MQAVGTPPVTYAQLARIHQHKKTDSADHSGGRDCRGPEPDPARRAPTHPPPAARQRTGAERRRALGHNRSESAAQSRLTETVRAGPLVGKTDATTQAT